MEVRYDNNVLQRFIRDASAIPPLNPANKIDWKGNMPGMSSVKMVGGTVWKVIKDGKTWIYGGDSKHNSFEIERQADKTLTVTVKGSNGKPILEHLAHPDGRFSRRVTTAKGNVVERVKDADGVVTTLVRNARNELLSKTVNYPNGDVRKTVKRPTGTVTRTVKNAKADRLKQQMNALVDKVKAQTEKTTLLYNRAQNLLNTAKKTLKKAEQTLKKKSAKPKQKSEGLFAKLGKQLVKGLQFVGLQIGAFVHRKLFGKAASKAKLTSTGTTLSAKELSGMASAAKPEVRKTTPQSAQLQTLAQVMSANKALWTPPLQEVKTVTNRKKDHNTPKGSSLRRR